jgi:hypothetical protein
MRCAMLIPRLTGVCPRCMQHAVNDSQPKSVKGTIAYLAPEVVLCNFNKAKYVSSLAMAA